MASKESSASVFFVLKEGSLGGIEKGEEEGGLGLFFVNRLHRKKKAFDKVAPQRFWIRESMGLKYAMAAALSVSIAAAFGTPQPHIDRALRSVPDAFIARVCVCRHHVSRHLRYMYMYMYSPL